MRRRKNGIASIKIEKEINFAGEGIAMRLIKDHNGHIVNEFRENRACPRPDGAIDVNDSNGASCCCYTVQGRRGDDGMFYGKLHVFTRVESLKGEAINGQVPSYVKTGEILADGEGITLNAEKTMHHDAQTKFLPGYRFSEDNLHDLNGEAVNMVRAIGVNAQASDRDLSEYLDGWRQSGFVEKITNVIHNGITRLK
jgi:hypothetical protein